MIVQRYPRDLWPMLRGERPFVLTGPNFKGCAKEDAGMKPFWRMTPDFVKGLRKAAQQLLDEDRRDARRMIAELLYEEQIVACYWATAVPKPTNLPVYELRRDIAIDAIAAEIPGSYHGNLADDTLELLDGMSSPEHYRSMLNQHDQVTLEQQLVVV